MLLFLRPSRHARFSSGLFGNCRVATFRLLALENGGALSRLGRMKAAKNPFPMWTNSFEEGGGQDGRFNVAMLLQIKKKSKQKCAKLLYLCHVVSINVHWRFGKGETHPLCCLFVSACLRQTAHMDSVLGASSFIICYFSRSHFVDTVEVMCIPERRKHASLCCFNMDALLFC